MKGATGKSAYQIAFELDPTIGTEAEWILSLKGKDGATWLSGKTAPEANKGVIGDFYYDSDACKIYKKEANGWTLVSTIKPAVSINDEGYWVIDGTTTEIKAEAVSPKIVDGVWVVGETNTGIEATGKSAYQIAFELDPTIGTEAEWILSLNGQKGETGATWLTGSGAPEVDARVGDFYLDTKSSDVYVKISTGWELKANIKGDSAPTIKSFRKVVDESNKWGMYYRYELTMSDNSKVLSETVKEIVENRYYTATEDGDIEKLLKEGVSYIKLGGDIALKDNYDEATKSNTLRIFSDLNLDLNGYTLTSKNRLIFTGAKVNITNGNFDLTLDRSGISAIQLQGGCVAKLNDVEFSAKVGSGFLVLGSKLEIEDSSIYGDVFVINTNAGKEEYYNVDIKIKDSLISSKDGNNYDNSAILMNVKGKLVLEDCEVVGDRQALIVRGGDATVKNTKLVLTGAWYDAQENDDSEETRGTVYMDENETWGDGNKVPSATLVLGNNASAYQYSATMTFENADVVTYNKMDIPNIFAKGNTTEEGKEYIGATLNINNDDLTLFDLASARIDYATVKMNTSISNKETLDEVMKFVKMNAMYGTPMEAILQFLNPVVTQDIMIVEEEMEFSKYEEYRQANLFLSSANSKYTVYPMAMCLVVSDQNELMSAIEMQTEGVIKLGADMTVRTDKQTALMLQEMIEQTYIITGNYQLNIVIGPQVTMSETFDADMTTALNEIANELYNKVENKTGSKLEYSLDDLKTNFDISIENFYVKFATIDGISNFRGLEFANQYGTKFVDTGSGFEDISVSIGNNVFVKTAPVYYNQETKEIYVATNLIAAEMMSSQGIAILYDGTEEYAERYQIQFEEKEISVLDLNPTSVGNEIINNGDGFTVKGNNTTSIVVLDFEGNENTDNKKLAVTKQVWYNKDSGTFGASAYGFTLADTATGKGTYTVGLYPAYGADLTNPETVELYANFTLHYTAFILGEEGVIETTIDIAPEANVEA